MNIDQIINRKHQQLNQIKARLFETVLVRDVELYTPDTVNNTYVLQDEDDFEEAEVVGSLKAERLPLSYVHQGTIKIIEVWPTTSQRFGLVRDGELNEFESNKSYYFLSLNANIPLQSVIQYQVITSLDESASQQISLIKVDERAIGKPTFVNQVHTFSLFHGDVV